MKKIFTLFAALFMAVGMYAQDDEDELLYVAEGAVIRDAEYDVDYTDFFPEKENIRIEAYDGYVIVCGLAGVEGYDIIIDFDEDDNVTALTPRVNGVDGKAYTKGYCNISTGLDDPNWNMMKVYLGTEYCYATSDETDQSGYVYFYYVYDYTSELCAYYYLVWGYTEEEDAVAAIKARLAKGATYNLAGQKVNANYKGVVVRDGKKMLQK